MTRSAISTGVLAAMCRGVSAGARRLAGLHANQQGTISILSTFAVLMFTMLLLLVTNVALQVDDKVKMQNAADSAAYSGGVVIARGMNAIAFTNHLECDVLGITAFLRECRDQNAMQFVPTILARWKQMAAKFAPAKFEKFIPLTAAIPDKSDKELELATAWHEMAKPAAEYALPVFEHILGTPENVQTGVDDHLIPNFQRAVLASVPTLAQEVTNEVALRHGMPSSQRLGAGPELWKNPQSAANGRSPQYGVLWRTSVLAVGIADETNPTTRTLPVVDPDPSQSDYYQVANGASLLSSSIAQRRRLADGYVQQWIDDPDLMRGLGFFGDEAKMSALHIDRRLPGRTGLDYHIRSGLIHVTTCAYLNELLNEEYPTTNVPMMLRNDFGGSLTDNEILDRDYTFVALAYRKHVNEMAPQMYRNPIDSAADAVTFAQVSVYVPRYMYHCCPWARPWYDQDGNVHWDLVTNGWPGRWDLFTQNWTVRLTPATTETLPTILQTNPGGYASAVRLPNLGGATMYEIDAVNTH